MYFLILACLHSADMAALEARLTACSSPENEEDEWKRSRNGSQSKRSTKRLECFHLEVLESNYTHRFMELPYQIPIKTTYKEAENINGKVEGKQFQKKKKQL